VLLRQRLKNKKMQIRKRPSPTLGGVGSPREGTCIKIAPEGAGGHRRHRARLVNCGLHAITITSL